MNKVYRLCSLLSFLAPLAAAGNLAVSFHDCGDASTDVVVKDVTPKTIMAGSTTTITGSGSLKKDLTGATYSMRMTGVLSTVLVKDCSGDAAQAQTCDIVAPLLGKVGSLAYEPVTFPIKAGDISGISKVAVTLKAGLPSSLETTTTTLKVKASNGDIYHDAICVQIMTKAAGDASVMAKPMLEDTGLFTPSPADLEKMFCKVAGNKLMEDMMTGKACTTAKELLNVTIPDCQANADKLWNIVAKMCPKDLEEATLSPGDIEKMICSLAGNKKIEDMITSKACSMVQERLNKTVTDCQENVEKL